MSYPYLLLNKFRPRVVTRLHQFPYVPTINGGTKGGILLGKLTARKVDALKEPGMYGDGNGLYLRIGPTGSKSWILRTRIKGRLTHSGAPLRWEGGLGGLSLVSLAEAREKAHELRKVARSGGDPSRLKAEKEVTFSDAAQTVYDGLRPTWRNEKHAQNWWASLESYVLPKIGHFPIDTIGPSEVLSVLSPIWTAKHETAKRTKQRISAIFDWAKGAGHFHGENPVNGVSRALPSFKAEVRHQPAMDWRDVPGFFRDLDQREGTSARTLQFIILTAARSGEARGAQWPEIRGDEWIVPPERMKMRREHRVPLCSAALGVVERARGLDERLVFPSVKRGPRGEAREQSVMVFKSLMKRMGVDHVTVHGFRSSFRDWAAEQARAPFEIAEACLAHSESAVVRAYARSDVFERRRELMEAWGRFCTSDETNVVRLANGN